MSNRIPLKFRLRRPLESLLELLRLPSARGHSNGNPEQVDEDVPFPDESPQEFSEEPVKVRSPNSRIIENQPAVKPNSTTSEIQDSAAVSAGKIHPVPEPHVSTQHVTASSHHVASSSNPPTSPEQALPVDTRNDEGVHSRDPANHESHGQPPLERHDKLEAREVIASASPGISQFRDIQADRRAHVAHEFTASMASVINDFTLHHKAELEEQKKKYHAHIKGLKKKLAKHAEVLAQQQSYIEAQNHEIGVLQQSGEQLVAQLKDIEVKLGESESRVRKMEQKYQTCKTHLNAAIKEQQTLYKGSKERCEQAIKQMQEMERSHRAEAESAVQKAEVIREQMTERLRQTIAQNKAEAAELYGTIENLTMQLSEKEAELNQEREHVRSLSEKLKALKESSQGFQELAVQGKEILKKLEEQQSEAEERHRQSAEALREKLASLASRLDGLAEMMSRQPKELDGLRQAQEESFNSVTSKIGEILSLQTASGEATSQLSSDIDHHMEKIWKRLDDQLESLSRHLAEKAEENGMMSTLYRRKEDECQQHAKEAASLRDVVKEQADQIQELEKALEACDFLQHENEDFAQRVEALDTETAQLKEEVQSKTTALAELRARLDAAETAHAAEVRNYKSSLQTLTQALQEQSRGSELAAQQAAEQARREAQAEADKAQRETERSLRDAQHERDTLLEKVEQLKRQIQEQEQSHAQGAATIHSLNERLTAEEGKRKTTAEQLAQRSARLVEVESKLIARTAQLETDLKTAQDRIKDLDEEARRERTRAEALVVGLERWVEREGHGVDGLSFLKDGSKSAEDISTGLTQVLGKLGLSERSNTGLIEESQPAEFSQGIAVMFSGGLSRNMTNSGLPGFKEGGSQEPLADSGGQEAVNEMTPTGPLQFASALDHLRRVVVRSPANVPEEPAPPSVDQEKTRRREAEQPRSIMKPVTRSMSSMLQQEDLTDAAGHGAFKRGRQEDCASGPSMPPQSIGNWPETPQALDHEEDTGSRFHIEADPGTH
ncbi:hypothetical protein VTJ49DRAFT_2285 [Mycothermus thermophilus]|uniref:Uncharacterized protein n=1 Tax=Humicola insolens TaxID=85995 RepID=A0ABR3VA34_HUMIN